MSPSRTVPYNISLGTEKRPKISACVHCRQMKLRCDSKALFPAPCSRCVKQNLACSIDPSFQRTAKRKRVLDLERELEEMKATISVSPGSPILHAQPPPVQTSQEIPPGSMQDEASPSGFLQPQQIGDIKLTAGAVSDIVDCFYANYHQHFPILLDHPDSMRDWRQSDFLLWTIIAIASRSSELYSSYHLRLEPHIRQMASSIYSFQDRPLQTVQALLLLCWWPFNFSATRDDPAWMYCGQAVHVALQHGLHRPHHHSDFVYRTKLDGKTVQAYERAWAGCFIVNQTLSSSLGIPATLRPTWASLGSTSAHSTKLPAIIEQTLKVACQSYHICHVLGDDDSTTSGLLPNPIVAIRAFETHLSSLEKELSKDCNPLVEVALHWVKLQLYSFALTANDPYPEQSQLIRPETTAWLVKASSSAISLIHLVNNRVTIKPWPTIVGVSMKCAVNFLLILSIIPGHQDRTAARNSIGEAWRLLHSRSEFEHDSMSRMCKIVAYLSRLYNEQDQDSIPKVLSVRSRMAANFLYENVWRAKTRFSQHVHDSMPVDYTAAAALEDLSFLELTDEFFDANLFEGFTTDEAFNWFAEL